MRYPREFLVAGITRPATRQFSFIRDGLEISEASGAGTLALEGRIRQADGYLGTQVVSAQHVGQDLPTTFGALYSVTISFFITVMRGAFKSGRVEGVTSNRVQLSRDFASKRSESPPAGRQWGWACGATGEVRGSHLPLPTTWEASFLQEQSGHGPASTPTRTLTPTNTRQQPRCGHFDAPRATARTQLEGTQWRHASRLSATWNTTFARTHEITRSECE